jgi:hypothetical protein
LFRFCFVLFRFCFVFVSFLFCFCLPCQCSRAGNNHLQSNVQQHSFSLG